MRYNLYMSTTLISIFAGFGGMFGWGISDFFANQASDSIGHRKAFFWSQIVGLGLIGVVALFASANFALSLTLLPFLLIAGIGYAVGYLFFYKGFEIGNVSVVSAVVNLQQLFIIGISYFVFKQQLTFIQIPAVALLLIGVMLVSVDFKDFKKKGISLATGVKETVWAAIMFGVLFWPFNEYIVERTDLFSASFYIKLIAIFTVVIITFALKQKLKLTSYKGNIVKVLLAVGLLEATAIISVSYGQAYGDSIIVAPISSALTVVTVSLAVIFLKERLTKYQGVGIALTIAGIIMMAF